MNRRLRNIALWLVIALIGLGLFAFVNRSNQRTAPTEISFSQLLTEADRGRVRSVVIHGSEIRGIFTDGRTFQTYATNDPTLTQRLYSKNVEITATPSDDVPWFVSLWISWLPIFAMIGVWIFLSRRLTSLGSRRTLEPFPGPPPNEVLGRNEVRYNVRRVVTVVDRDGKAVALFDGANPHKMVRPNRNTVSRLLWTTDGSPAAMSEADRAAVNIGIAPPAGGSVFRIVDFPPVTAEIERLDPANMHGELAAHAPKRGLPPRRPLMHRTRTVD
jgi:hypothetical protein